ncbi:hypothetical protein J4Q44_G00000680 [Coregonus suidteri]|uniref:Uncharacterized protein n=1 Tax=Coregonus suidteri TaxID=861788 RepID=A0AAN8MP76_9TELE
MRSSATWEGLMGPMLPAQFARMTSLSAPGVALMTGDWRPHSTSDKRLARRRAPCAATLVLHTEQKTTQEKHTEILVHAALFTPPTSITDFLLAKLVVGKGTRTESVRFRGPITTALIGGEVI